MTGTFWWLSFCDGTKPKGEQFIGVCIIPTAADAEIPDVVREAYARGCNPGGDVLGYVWIDGGTGVDVPDEYVGRLLTHAEARGLDDFMFRKYAEIAIENPYRTDRGPVS